MNSLSVPLGGQREWELYPVTRPIFGNQVLYLEWRRRDGTGGFPA